MAEQLPDTQKADSSNLSYPTNGRSCTKAGDIALQATCGGFDSHTFHKIILTGK